MASLTANGITIEYSERGSGEPLLLIMGLGGQLIDWPVGFVDELVARGFRVITFDNRDAGLSTEMTSEAPTVWQLAKAAVFRGSVDVGYQIDDMAADTVGLLDGLGIERCNVVGMSMGGMIAQSMAIHYPQRVGSLTSIMSTTGSRRVGQPTMRMLSYFLRRPEPTAQGAVQLGWETLRQISGPTWDPELMWAMAEASVARSFRPRGSARQVAAVLASSDRTEALSSVTAPTLVIHGLRDELVQPSGGIATAESVPGSSLLMFDDMAHDLPATRWSEMADASARTAVSGGWAPPTGPRHAPPS